MSIPQLVGKYNDPTFHHIKAAFNQRSDDYPVLMLPVRLETKFMKYSRIIKPDTSGTINIGAIIQDSYHLIYKIQTFFLVEKEPTSSQLTTKRNAFAKELKRLIDQVSKIKEATRADKLVLRDAGEDLVTVLKIVEEDTRYEGKINVLSDAAEELLKSINRIKTPSRIVFEKGKKYLNALEKLNKSIDAIFVSNKINAAKLDAELKNIDQQIDQLDSLADAPDFAATEEMIKQIQSKISHIKRQHKSGNVRLTNFKIGYTGTKDLKREEYELRKKINDLKTRIEKEHVPVVKVKEKLKTYPVKQLNAQIVKANFFLMRQNRLGIKSYSSLSSVQKELGTQLKTIHTNAKIPLDGSLEEVKELKSNYSKLKSQLITYQRNITRIRVINPAQKASLTKINKQLSAYLNDLKELDPKVKKIENQILAEDKIRLSSHSALTTRHSVLNARDVIRHSATNAPKKQLEVLNTQLIELQKKIKISASNTILLPRSEYNQLKSAYFSLRDQVNNVLKANPLPESEQSRATADASLVAIENHILDQLVDINDPRDRFYEAHKDRVIFRVPSTEVMELWVRIFPDDIAVDNHDERFTDDEIIVAQDFYYEVYSKAESFRKEAEKGAWRAAASSLGVRRAAYAIKTLRPEEVSKNDVEQVINQFDAYLKKELGYRDNVLTRTKSEAKIGKLLDSFKNAPREIKKILIPKRFTVCSENKKTLDEALSYFRELIDLIGSWVTTRSSAEQKASLKQLAVYINESGKIVYEFYKSNLMSLNEPFRPNLTFPKVEKKDKSWDRAGMTKAMPDRFVVVTKRGNNYQHIVTGKTIPNPLPLSLDPSGNQFEQFNHLANGDLEVPKELSWMFDFEAAVEAGMGVKIPLDKTDFDEGFDLVMAYGVQNKDAKKSQDLINQLFTNHLYSEGGLEYLPLGTATNNTEKVKSPYRALDNDFDAAYEVFFGDKPEVYPSSFDDANELSISDGQFFQEALGLPIDLTNLIRNYDKKDICHGRAMNRALFGSTLKYYFRVMVNNLLENYDINQTMLFMLHHVSAIGTLPVFRVDNQPYGVIPVSPVKLFKSQGALKKGTESNYIKNLTLFLKQTKVAFENFPHRPITINSSEYSSNPQGQFMKILGLEPFSKEFFFRFGVNAANRWQDPDGGEGLGFTVNWDLTHDAFGPSKVANTYSQLLQGLGHTSTNLRNNAISKSPIYKNRFSEGNFILGHLVQDPRLGNNLAQTDKEFNYIEWLTQAPVLNQITQLKYSDLPKVEVEGETQVQYSVLMALLRGALVYDRSTYATNAMDVLKDLDVGTLERLLASHIDLVSYRLDAWLTGLSDFRLRELRKVKSSGTYLGAYGFVHDLRREKSPHEVVSALPEGLESSNGQPVTRLPDSQGFIHGPSMNHAVTAAVLRAGYNSIKAKGDTNNALAINLTSSRIRKALHLLEGVGNGQEIGALLGYMFERALHEKYKDGQGKPLEMDKYIYRLRRKFPTYSDDSVDPQDTTQTESLKAANVVDGLALIDHFEEFLGKSGLLDPNKTLVDNIINEGVNPTGFRGYPWNLASQVPNPSNPGAGSTPALERKKLKAIIHELDNMADAFDALGDLMTAEGVYQLVRGNHVKASAVLDAIAEGKVNLDPDIIRSMRQGVMVTHRALVQIPLVKTTNSPWSGVTLSPRGKAEPSINHWLASKIGDPTKITWKVKIDGVESEMNLLDLDLQPIDLVLLIVTGGEDSQQELKARCLDFLRDSGIKVDLEIELLFNAPAAPSDLSFGEVVSLLQHLGKIIGASRSADARDYRVPEEEINFGMESAGVDTQNLLERMKKTYADYRDLLDVISPFESGKTSYSPAEKEVAFNSLKTLSVFGFSGFYPSDPEEDILVMAQRLVSAKAKMLENLAFADTKFAEFELEADQSKWLEFSIEFCKKFFGSGFKMLPKITVSNESDISAQLTLPLSEGPFRNQESELFLEDWWSEISHVRNRLSHLETVSMLDEVLHGNSISFKPVQLPFDMNNLPQVSDREYWLGAEYPQDFEPNGDRLSLLIFGYEALQQKSCALFLDEWTEIIPDQKQTTGLAFHFNQPDSRAPQSLLLAVPPEKKGKWDFEELALCVEEAFNLSKLRSIEPDHVEESMYSQLLPATSALAFGDDEFARKLAESDEDSSNNSQQGDEQKLGFYIDFTSVNDGFEPEES